MGLKNLTSQAVCCRTFLRYGLRWQIELHVSDQSSEYELWIKVQEGKFETKKITNYGPGF